MHHVSSPLWKNENEFFFKFVFEINFTLTIDEWYLSEWIELIYYKEEEKK